MPRSRTWILWLALAGCGEATGPGLDGAPRNLLLVTLDTTRADHLGGYGMRAGVTPCLDELAREGVVFEQAMTPVPITLPAHTSLLTGTYPPFHGVHDNGTFTLAPEFTTLAEVLSAEGFATAAFVAARVLDRRYGLAQGFDVYEDVPRGADEDGRFAVELPAERVVDRVLAWLDRIGADAPGGGEGAGRFFAWVHFFDPHNPYAAPAPFRERFAGEPYLAEIASVDQQLARLLGQLEARGWLDATLVVVSSDHGEGLGEHGEDTHTLLAYQATLHVPLIMRHPSLPAGTRVSVPVSLVDVMPSALGRLGLRTPPVQGLDLFAAPPPADRELYFETEFALHNFGWSALRGTRSGDDKFISAPRPERYDLGPDPGEIDNLLAPRPTDADPLAQRLARLRASLAEGRPSASARRELTPDEAQALQALGYASALDDDEPSAERAAVDPKDRIAYAGRVVNLWTTYLSGDLEKARRDAELVLAENPRVVLAWETLGSMTLQEARDLKGAGQLERAAASLEAALAQFERALEIDPARIDSLLQKGVILRQLERSAEAAAVFARCIELQPEGAMPYRWLGLHLEATGEAQGAAAHYARFLELWTEPGRLRDDTVRRLELLRSD